MNEIIVTDNELQDLSDYMGAQFLNEFIPLPGVSKEYQKEVNEICKETEHSSILFPWSSFNFVEDDSLEEISGKCCSDCGQILVWDLPTGHNL